MSASPPLVSPAPQPHLPRGQGLWRLNQLGLLSLRAEPGEPIGHDLALGALDVAEADGLWQPEGPRRRKRSHELMRAYLEHVRREMATWPGYLL
jgi:hypothetical protein